MNNFWNQLILNNTVRDWMIVCAITLGFIIFFRLLQSVIIKRIKAYAATTTNLIDDFIVTVFQSSVMPLLYILAFYFSSRYIRLPDKADNILRIAVMLFITFFLLRIITSSIGYFFKRALVKRGKDEQREKQAKGILLIVQIIVWLIGFLFLVDNLGYDITTLVAGLGIGGIAIALASQAILGDLFSYLVIFFDKPFEIGDFITIQDKMGTVEYIGIKSTRLRALGGEQLICSNTDLTNSRIHNFKRMQERRIEFSFKVAYTTPAAKLKMIPPLVKQIIESLETTRFERAHFQAFGDFSLNFQVAYFVLTPDYNIYMDIQQSINLKIFELFEKEEIQFALPTQHIFVNRMNQEEGAAVNESMERR